MVCLAVTAASDIQRQCFAAMLSLVSASLQWSKDIENIGHGLLRLPSETIDITQWLDVDIGASKASRELNWID